MINLIVVYDDKADVAGDYFLACKQDIENFVSEQQNIIAVYWSSHKCSQTYIDINIPKDKLFIFIAYSHGIEDALVQNGNIPYIRAGLNANYFLNSLFITNACLVEKKLGKELIDNGVKGFIGFDIEAEFLVGFEQYFIYIDNYFFKIFILREISIKEALELLIKEYNRLIDEWDNILSHPDKQDLIPIFEDLKNSLVGLYRRIGNNHLTHKDFDT